MSANRSHTHQAHYSRNTAPRFSESYLQFQHVQSRFRKHSPVMLYMLHVVVLFCILFGLAQAARALCFDAYRLSILMGNHTQIQGYYENTLAENQLLNEKITIYSSPAGIEELARNNLEKVGSNEILVRLHP